METDNQDGNVKYKQRGNFGGNKRGPNKQSRLMVARADCECARGEHGVCQTFTVGAREHATHEWRSREVGVCS